MMTARHDAKGRVAHQTCNLDGCLCRMDFSRTACLLTRAIGKSTSARRLHSFGIMVSASLAGNRQGQGTHRR